MLAVILAGGLGTRLSEETILRPKPLVEIGGMPILWHILKIYSQYGINEFVICCGYKGYLIKEYFANYSLYMSDITFHMDEDNRMEVHQKRGEPWKVTLVDTGDLTETAGRLKRVMPYIKSDSFCFTYGDGLANINISKLIDFHKKNNRLITLTAVKPPGRYGALKVAGSKVIEFTEKPDGDLAWINGGFFVVEKEVANLITSDDTSWENDVLPLIASQGELSSFYHDDFWQPMDTLRDKNKLQDLWISGQAPWKLW